MAKGITFSGGYAAGYADGRQDMLLDRPRFPYQRPTAKSDSFHKGYHCGYMDGYIGKDIPEKRPPKSLTAAERQEIVKIMAAGGTKDEIRIRYGISAGSVTTLLRQAAAGR